MERLTVVFVTDGENKEVWGSLKRFCKFKNLSYGSMKHKKFPFNHKVRNGKLLSFEKINFNGNHGI